VIKAFGLKVGAVTTAKFERRVTELVAHRLRLLAMVHPMLIQPKGREIRRLGPPRLSEERSIP